MAYVSKGKLAQWAVAEDAVHTAARGLFVAWSVDCSLKAQLAAAVAKQAATKPYPVIDELFVWSVDGVRLANADELREHGRS